ncbi:alpha-N-acetylglucosaminidase [Alistipes sp.]|uniref:alpha-N-acetylglucosaminidase n=1 Tax=Alistipes sp. TaxID=1872444 RepID=UPI0025C60F65|nr:alpha-N-acetylglucosaminidase [Alistipes sp.]
MLRLLAPLVLLFLAGSCNTDDDAAVRALARRIIPEQEHRFRFEHIADTADCFELESRGGRIIVRGNNSTSIAVGLNHYLKNYCLTTVSWNSCNPVEMPSVLPPVEGTVRGEARAKERFFLNYCTFGYTMPWWGWTKWERFIDWMALQGVTMPLAITGQEAVWEKVWTKLGLTEQEVRAYFTGPAHLPWHRMSNIDYWQGPLPQEWLQGQLELQQRIVARERELGMKPVLPAFAGHVPQEIKRLYPDARITRVSYWGGFADEYRCSFLDPMDPLFEVIQREFLTEQTRLFGTDHIYGADPFNEIDAPTWDPETLAGMSRHIYESLSKVDPEAVWLQMGWLFYADPTHWTQENIQAFLGAVPQDKLLMLDYFCEFTEIWKQTRQFYGQPYLWCYLGNFGGNTMLSGNFRTVSARMEDAFANGGGNLWGVGSTLEGFGVNQFMYEFILDKAWKTGLSDDEWIDRLADRRTGYRDPAARSAWHTICDSIYTQPAQTGLATLTCAHPSLEGNWYWTTKPTVGYEFPTLWKVWEQLLAVGSDRDTYRFDVVNLGRQVLGDYFLRARDRFAEACARRDLAAMDAAADCMRGLLADLDRLVACHPEFSLEAWIDSARGFGTDPASKDYYETNARTLVSIWGDSYHLTDYASRAWAGMVSTYYAPRWELFIDRVTEAVRAGRTFDQKAFDREIRDFECRWSEASTPLTYPEAGDAVATARELALKYKPLFDSLQ